MPPRRSDSFLRRDNDNDIVRSITATRFYNKWVDIVLAVVSIIQGFAFANLAQKLPEIWTRVVHQGELLVGIYFLFSFSILLRVFQTYVLAALDYEEWNVSFSDVLFIFVIGAFEYLLFSTLTGGIFDPVAFHARAIVLFTFGFFVYIATLAKLRPTQFLLETLYRNEVRLQRANVAGAAAITLISTFVLIVHSSRLYFGAGICGAVVPLINIWYSLKKTISLRLQIISLPPSSARVGNEPTPVEGYLIRPAVPSDIKEIAALLVDEFYYVYESLFEASPRLTRDLLARLLTANAGHHSLGYKSFVVAVAPDGEQPVGIMSLTSAPSFAWPEIRASARFLFTLLRYFGPQRVLSILRNVKSLATIVPLSASAENNISYVAVAGEHRRRGVASALVHYAIGQARALGAHSLLAEIRDTNDPGRRLFEANGFKEIAVLKSASDTLLSRGARVLVKRELAASREMVLSE